MSYTITLPLAFSEIGKKSDKRMRSFHIQPK